MIARNVGHAPLAVPHDANLTSTHPGYHYEYPVKTVDYEPVTRTETVPVSKQI